MTSIMLDLETLGTRPGSVILAIGAARVGGPQTSRTFYARIDPASCERAGLTMDLATVMWWLGRPAAARREILKCGEPLAEVLGRFAEWLGDDDVEVWANAPSFDCALLGAAYERLGMKLPWKFWNERCFRTAAHLLRSRAAPKERVGIKHHALDDALTQAKRLAVMTKPRRRQ
jgi:DNA polymerase III epsilon subunit-like protein